MRPTAAIRQIARSDIGVYRNYTIEVREAKSMLILLVLFLVLLFAGIGFAAHLVWIAAVVLFVFWIVGLALGRGAGAGRHGFYRW